MSSHPVPVPSAWMARSDARRLRAWRQAELAWLANVLRQAYAGWRQAWGLSFDETAVVSCAPARETRSLDGWVAVEGRNASGVSMRWSAGAQADLQSLLGTGPMSSPLLTEAIAACMRDAGSRLASALDPGPGAKGEVDALLPSGQWSGAVAAFLPCGSSVLMEGGCVERALRSASAPARPPRDAAPALVPLLEAARASAVRLEARLCACELDLALLQRLRPGDVIRLPHPLDRPISVHGADGRALVDGFLARSHGLRALELAPAAA